MIKLDADYLERVRAEENVAERRLAAAVVLQWVKDLQGGRGNRWEILSWPESDGAHFWVERVLKWDVRIVQDFRDRWFRKKYGYEYRDRFRHSKWARGKRRKIRAQKILLR